MTTVDLYLPGDEPGDPEFWAEQVWDDTVDLDIDGTGINLDLDEVKRLRDFLNEALGDTVEEQPDLIAIGELDVPVNINGFSLGSVNVPVYAKSPKS